MAALALGASAATAAGDTTPPRGAAGGVRSPVREPMELAITASDDGGLAAVTAVVDGAVVAQLALGGATAVEAAPLRVDLSALALGPHRLEVRLSDVAGNQATIHAGDVVVAGPPPVYTPTVRVTLGNPATTPATPGATPLPATHPATERRCAYPRLKMALTGRVRRTPGGRAILRRGRHRLTGSLTCRAGSRRIRAPRGISIQLAQKRGKRLFGKAGLVTTTGGMLSVRLSLRSSRTLIFSYPAGRPAARVRLAVLVR